MNIKLLFFLPAFILVLFQPDLVEGQSTAGNIDGIYQAMSENSLALVNNQLEKVSEQTDAKNQGYRGALLMKKAGLIDGPAEKLKTFKEGKELMEEAISKDSNNPEFRFLRLMIQENAPAILGYKDNIEEDRALIIAAFPDLYPSLKNAIRNYSKESTILNPEDFQ